MYRTFTSLCISIIYVICFSLNAQIPTNGLVAFYPFNGNANDESGNGSNGIVYGATLATDRCDKPDSAYSLSGINDNIYIGDISNLDGSNALSISAWIYSDGITDEHTGTIVSKYNADGNSERVFIFDMYPDNTLRFCIYGADGNGDWEKQRTNNSIPVSQWNHVVVNWNGLSHNIDIYVNGIEVESHYEKFGDSPTMIYNKTSPLMIGGSDFGIHALDYMFNGSIDDVIIYSRELTFNEILNLYYFDCQDYNIIGENLVCQGQQDVTYSIQSIINANYAWDYTGTGVSISDDADSVRLDFADNSTSGTLLVTITLGNVTYQIHEFAIQVNPLPADAGIIVGEKSVCEDQSQYYSAPIIDNATIYNWEYSGTGVTINENTNEVLLYFANGATSGNLVVNGINSCGSGSKSPELFILVNSCDGPFSNLNIPNAFSPNGDGVNDLFVINGIPENSQLIIFDRRGEIIYKSDNYQNDWDGKDLDGNNLETGTYWYVLKLVGIHSDFKGFVYLKK